VRKYEHKIAAMKKAGKDLQGHDNPVYAATIEETDRSVGAIIDKLDGEDLTELIFAGRPLGERNLFWNLPSYNRPDDPARCPRSAMRRGYWKVHHRYEDNGYELYNLKDDIGESRDLAKSRPEILDMMRRELEACYDRFGAVKTLPPNPEYNADQ